MRARVFSKLVLIILIVSLSGCNQYTTKKRVRDIEEAITSYNIAMRWAQYETAYDYHVLPDGTKPPADLDALKRLSVTKVYVSSKILNDKRDEAIINTEISYYFKDQGTVKSIKLEQHWWVNEKTTQWFIDGAFPEFE